MREEALPIGHRSFGVSSDISGMAYGAWRLGRVGGVGGEPSFAVAPWIARTRTGSPWGSLAFGDATSALPLSRAHLVIFLIVAA